MEDRHMKRLTIWATATILLLLAGYSQAQKPPTAEEQRARLQRAEAMFAERCKTAGETIKRTVENVEGIYLLKLRPEWLNRGDQFAMDDPYGSDTGGDGYIKNFLFGRNDKGSIAHEHLVSIGYRYVEANDPKDGKRYRYTGRVEEPWQRDKHYLKGYTRFILDKVPAPGAAPRYGVTYDDISTREERVYWIAGSSLKVVDLKTKEVIAERIGYMMDRGQGDTSGDRAPWLLATYSACPAFPMASGNHPLQIQQTRKFVESVLHIKQER
jgi:hypothetical protein